MYVCPASFWPGPVNFKKSCREEYHKRVFATGVLAAGQFVFFSPVLFLSILIMVVHKETHPCFQASFLKVFNAFPLPLSILLFIDGAVPRLGTTSPGKTKKEGWT